MLDTYLYNRALDMCQRGRLGTFPTTANHINKRITRYPAILHEKTIHDVFLRVFAQHQSVLKEARLEMCCLGGKTEHVQRASVPGMPTGYMADVDLA